MPGWSDEATGHDGSPRELPPISQPSRGPVRDVFARSSFLEELGADKFSFTTHEAFQRAIGESLPFDPRCCKSN